MLAIVGEASYQPAYLKIAGGKLDSGARLVDHTAVLVPEPRNRYDRNAIGVTINGLTVGHLNRNDAVAYRDVIWRVVKQGFSPAASARLTGGWNRGPEDQGTIGVVLHWARRGSAWSKC